MSAIQRLRSGSARRVLAAAVIAATALVGCGGSSGAKISMYGAVNRDPDAAAMCRQLLALKIDGTSFQVLYQRQAATTLHRNHPGLGSPPKDGYPLALAPGVHGVVTIEHPITTYFNSNGGLALPSEPNTPVAGVVCAMTLNSRGYEQPFAVGLDSVNGYYGGLNTPVKANGLYATYKRNAGVGGVSAL